ncbi:MAG: hypothetical protein LBT21_00305 [Oscillospiraceae bacterium]|jgi:hypothetical protein|nr:hypothetical protein [Oscillospiraceae bacterium]
MDMTLIKAVFERIASWFSENTGGDSLDSVRGYLDLVLAFLKDYLDIEIDLNTLF